MGIPGQRVQSIHGALNSNQENKNVLKCSTWNIRRGLITRDLELRKLLKNENIDVMFLTETDTKAIPSEDKYQIQGYKTVFQERKSAQSKLRIIWLVKNLLAQKMKVRKDLMSGEFPSIWIEVLYRGVIAQR